MSYKMFYPAMCRTIYLTKVTPFMPAKNYLLYEHKLNQNVRYYSQKNFFQNLMDKIKEETEKDKNIKESIKKFRAETEKLEKSKELQSIRDFYKKIEKEIPSDTLNNLREKADDILSKIQNETDNMKRKELIKKGLESMKKATDQLSDVKRNISESNIMKSAVEGVKAVDKEIVSDRANVYCAPSILKSRSELAGKFKERIVEANEEAQGMVLHKDSKWYNAWQDFKDNNQYARKYFDLRTKYEESENPMLQSLRFVTGRVSQVFSSMGTNNEVQRVLDEISKMDPNFNLEGFVKFCRFDVIPNVLEAITKGNLEILQDWCHEAPYNILATPLRQAKEMNLIHDSHVLDISNVDVQMGKFMEQGPVLIITFQAQQISCLRNSKGSVVEGDPEKVLRVTHVWALCRDQTELHPWSSWRILDIAMMPSEQWL